MCLSVSLSFCPSLQHVCLHACVHAWYVCASTYHVLACFIPRSLFLGMRTVVLARALAYECVGSVCVLTRARACKCTYVSRTNGRSTCPLQCGNAVRCISRSFLRLCVCACVLCARTRACVHVLRFGVSLSVSISPFLPPPLPPPPPLPLPRPRPRPRPLPLPLPL